MSVNFQVYLDHQVLFEEESPNYYGHSLVLPLLMTGPPFESLVKVIMIMIIIVIIIIIIIIIIFVITITIL